MRGHQPTCREGLARATAGLLCLLMSTTALAGIDLNDPSLDTDEFWQQYYAQLSRQQQPLQNNTRVNVSVQAGARAALSCRVKHLGDRAVSWIRRPDFHVLTSREQVFTSDQRFSVQRRRFSGQEDWALSIWPVAADDRGVYECQVSTGRGSLSQFVDLTVVEPVARILGSEVYRIEEGSEITLLCVIDEAISEVPSIRWWSNNHTLSESTRVRIQTTSGGAAPGQGSAKVAPRSQLHIRAATFLDSGLYTCDAPGLTPATVHVFVTEGDKTAAIQRRSGSEPVTSSPPHLWLLLSLCWLRWCLRR